MEASNTTPPTHLANTPSVQLKPINIGDMLRNGSIDLDNSTQLLLALQYMQGELAHGIDILKIMQAGFGFFEAGSVRGKNVINMLLKNVLDAFVGGMAYWSVGFAFAFGEPANWFIGHHNFFGTDLSSQLYSTWFFHYSFCVTAATIVSGAVAERCDFRAYAFYSLFITGFTYPVVTHWAWYGGGWLNWLGYQDFAGSGVVHMTGGSCALVGAIMCGPRLGRFGQGGEPDREILGHNLTSVILGAFLLFVGFFAFNGGSQASISVALDGEQTGRAMMNTVLAGSPAAVLGTLLYRFGSSNGKWSLLGTVGAALAGMVSICAGCNAVDPWAAAVIGAIAAVVFYFTSKLIKFLKIDDPVDAVAVHLGAGSWGVIAAPLFDRTKGVFIFWRKDSFMALLWNFVGGLSIFLWAVGTTLPIFWFLKKVNWLRVPEHMELIGLDVIKHGESAYPEWQSCADCKADFADDRVFAGEGEEANVNIRQRSKKFAKHRGSITIHPEIRVEPRSISAEHLPPIYAPEKTMPLDIQKELNIAETDKEKADKEM